MSFFYGRPTNVHKQENKHDICMLWYAYKNYKNNYLQKHESGFRCYYTMPTKAYLVVISVLCKTS